MKFKIIILYFVLTTTYGLSQQNSELKKWKCFKKMPQVKSEIQRIDTLFIIYQKSDDLVFIQKKYNINQPSEYKYYQFTENLFFPIKIYDTENFNQINFREPKIMYKKKSYICKNMFRTIDVNFLQKWGLNLELPLSGYYTKFFVIELDYKLKGKYKIVQVNTPEIFTD